MSKQIKNKRSHRQDVDNYHKELRYLIKTIDRWDHGNIELQEFLDNDNDLEPRLIEFVIFRETWESVRYIGSTAKIFQNLRIRELKILAQMLFSSVARRSFYLKYLGEKIRCAPEKEVEPVSLIELEQRYQYHLYKKNYRRRGFEPKLNFDSWRETENCVTFYDHL